MSEDNTVLSEFPKYICHKEVHALKIESILFDRDVARNQCRQTDGTAMITPVDKRYTPFKVGVGFVAKHNPQAGGYYVVYEDGYESFSPAEAFEDGYELVK